MTTWIDRTDFAGQVPWLSTLGQEVLDLVPDGYDIVLDAGTPRAVRLSASATARAPTARDEG